MRPSFLARKGVVGLKRASFMSGKIEFGENFVSSYSFDIKLRNPRMD